MSRLHSLRASLDEVAAFLCAVSVGPLVIPPATIEGVNRIVMYAVGSGRRLRLMRWGFPRLARDMRAGGDDPGIIGLVADLTNPMWEHLVVDRRYCCIIPITHFANPDGDPGEKTRTWFSLKEQPIMGWAGFCRNVPDVGPCYAGMTMEANSAVMPTNHPCQRCLSRTSMSDGCEARYRMSSVFSFGRPLRPNASACCRSTSRGAGAIRPRWHSNAADLNLSLAWRKLREQFTPSGRHKRTWDAVPRMRTVHDVALSSPFCLSEPRAEEVA